MPYDSREKLAFYSPNQIAGISLLNIYATNTFTEYSSGCIPWYKKCILMATD